MLKRIISAFVGIVVGVSVLLIDNKFVYTAVLTLIGTIGVWELIHAVKCDKHKLLTWVCIAFSVAVPVLLNLSLEFDIKRNIIVFSFVGFVFVLLLIMLLHHKTIRLEHIAMCGCAATVIPASLSCLIYVRYLPWYSEGGFFPGVFMLVYMLFCAWFGDSGAYFVGTFLGKHKLCPNISPKKTVEGFVGGIVTVGIVAAIQCVVYNELLLRLPAAPEGFRMNYFVLVPVAMMASIVGVLGDLTASVIKRQYDVKDFGNLMPGHGGVLDRFDSVLFVAPFLYAVFSVLSPLQ
ncbi:MAG: phosphatidate cytidylyltransferase [Oscillospiraceae bacterium]